MKGSTPLSPKRPQREKIRRRAGELEGKHGKLIIISEKKLGHMEGTKVMARYIKIPLDNRSHMKGQRKMKWKIASQISKRQDWQYHIVVWEGLCLLSSWKAIKLFFFLPCVTAASLISTMLSKCSMDCKRPTPPGFNNRKTGCTEYFCLEWVCVVLPCSFPTVAFFNALQIIPRIAVRLSSHFPQLTSTLFIYDYGSLPVYSAWLF